MNFSKPRSLLSFIYNTTMVPSYRTEMHMDMRRAFERFGVTNGVAQAACFNIEQATYGFRTTTDDVAAKRVINGAKYDAAKALIAEAAPILFKEVADELVRFAVEKRDDEAVAPLAGEISPTSAPRAPKTGFGPLSIPAAEGSPTLTRPDPAGVGTAMGVMAGGISPTNYPFLSYGYYFFHYRAARAAILADPSGSIEAVKTLAGLVGPAGEVEGYLAVHKAFLRLGEVMNAKEAVSAAAARELIVPVCRLLATEYETVDCLYCW
ncbi:MAG TPA: hypothetical protein VMT03_05775 [Polyangia bacterium]|nr:hypothetical protein [Polyangia bacterium]